MFSRVNYTVVGLFVVVLGIALIAAGLWFSADLDREEGQRLLLFPDEPLSGLSRNSSVKYQGLNVGRVLELGLDDRGRVRVLLSVQDNVPVYADTRVRIATQGLTGLAHLEMVPGSAESGPPSSDGHPYPVLESAPSLRKRLEQAAEDGLGSIERMSERLDRLLSEENVRAVGATMDHLEQISGAVARNSESLDQTFEETTGLIRETRVLMDSASETLTGIDETTARFNATLGRFDQAAASIDTLAASLEQTRQRGDGTIERINRETLPEINRLLLDVRGLTRTLDRLGEDFADHPDQLIFGAPRRPPGPGERD